MVICPGRSGRALIYLNFPGRNIYCELECNIIRIPDKRNGTCILEIFSIQTCIGCELQSVSCAIIVPSGFLCISDDDQDSHAVTHKQNNNVPDGEHAASNTSKYAF